MSKLGIVDAHSVVHVAFRLAVGFAVPGLVAAAVVGLPSDTLSGASSLFLVVGAL